MKQSNRIPPLCPVCFQPAEKVLFAEIQRSYSCGRHFGPWRERIWTKPMLAAAIRAKHVATLEPAGGNLYRPHALQVTSGQFWRCAHGTTGFGKDGWQGCKACAEADPKAAEEWNAKMGGKPALEVSQPMNEVAQVLAALPEPVPTNAREAAIAADVFNPNESDADYAARRARELGVSGKGEPNEPEPVRTGYCHCGAKMGRGTCLENGSVFCKEVTQFEPN